MPLPHCRVCHSWDSTRKCSPFWCHLPISGVYPSSALPVSLRNLGSKGTWESPERSQQAAEGQAVKSLRGLRPLYSFAYSRAARLQHCQQPVSCMMNLRGRCHATQGNADWAVPLGPLAFPLRCLHDAGGLSYPHSELSQDSDDIFGLDLSLQTAAILFQSWDWELGGPRLERWPGKREGGVRNHLVMAFYLIL